MKLKAGHLGHLHIGLWMAVGKTTVVRSSEPLIIFPIEIATMGAYPIVRHTKLRRQSEMISDAMRSFIRQVLLYYVGYII